MPTFLRVIIPLYCIIPLAQLINTLLILVVTEKENKIKDGLKMIGISDVAYWCSWFAIYGGMTIIFAGMFTVVMHFMSVLKNINPVIIFLLFMFFGFSIITFAFALTPFFHKPKTAGAVGTLVMQFTGMLFMLQTFLLDPSNPIIMPLRLISSVAFTTALDTACAYEYSGGIALKDLLPGEKGSGILYSLIFLVFDTFFYGFIAVYLDNVIPNEYGVKKNPFYFLLPSYWIGSTRAEANTQYIDELEGLEENISDDVEKVHPSMIGKESFRIRKLCKTYTSWFSNETTEAVKEISLDIYENQITALIGRNGAGKSTLINIMTGLVMPTSGRCVVFGLDIAKPHDMMRLRKMTGVCMQQDLHFSSMTVTEHLVFYGELRGVPKLELEAEIDELLQELELTQQRTVRAAKLSGGQKRKLSVAIALIGSPKIILLDEPSAGVDPVSRRQLWSLLQKKKQGRVILLTTHFMDEADVLADSKAIIHNGILKCVGSSLFLKSRFGVGYQLTVELDETKLINSLESDNIITNWIPEAIQSRKIIANEIKYTLPHSQVSKFPEMFGDFEKSIGAELSTIISYGVSMTTLSEVFLKISNDMEISDPKKTATEIMPHRRMSSSSQQGSDVNDAINSSLTTENQGDNLIPNIGDFDTNTASIFKVMCALRLRRLIRNPASLFFMVVMPVLLVIIGFIIVKSQSINQVDETFIFSFENDFSVYPKAEMNLAVSSSAHNDSSFGSFIQQFGINVFPYTGNFTDLLHLNGDIGTLTAVMTDPQFKVASIRQNGTFQHVPGIALNAINQYFFNSTSAKIRTANQPFPTKNPISFDASTVYAAFLIGPAFTFSAVGMVMEIVNDREKHTRNHLRVNGVSFSMYFTSMFFVYGMLSLLITLMEIVVILAFNLTAFTNPYAITITLGLLILFIFPCLLFSAAFSYVFDRMETAQSVFSQLCSWMGMIVGIAMILIDNLAPDSAMLMHVIFSFLDIFYIPFGIFYFTQKQYFKCTFANTCDSLSFKDYTGHEFTVMAVAMLVQIPIYSFWLLVADVVKNGGRMSGVFKFLNVRVPWISSSGSKICDSSDPSVLQNISDNDEDVQNEKSRVDDYFSQPPSHNSKCVVAVQDIHKVYRLKRDKKEKSKSKYINRKVLHGIDLMVEEGEVFGLLGHNGAGKTTTIKLIIAEEDADSGRIRLCDYDIESNLSEAFQSLGYCPQHDALWDNITLREHIELYAIVRGVKPNIRNNLVKHFIKGLQIEEHSEKKSNTLSGGTKRKLSYCMSILGSPRIVLLDEPSTGMDIMSKRFLWNTIIGTFKDNRGAILTTHSMEEADALCTRIGIMNKGSIVCIGSPQHLKSKFGAGYNLEIKLKIEYTSYSTEPTTHEEKLAHAKERFAFVDTHFPGATQTQIFFENRAVYSIPKATISSIAQTFSLLETLKGEYDIEEYNFSQTTLDNVFLQFATNNQEDQEESNSS
ncbi:ATP-binding cassette sub-family A member 8-B isoform X2 [Folsomia candida]|nr:ATP-binding cassette sub-family A member 8-B isoform X2 [Folsomia candida]